MKEQSFCFNVAVKTALRRAPNPQDINLEMN